MGCAASGPKLTDEEKRRIRQIEDQLRKDKKRLLMEIKLLLLGAGESGKSTIAKQMKIIHLEGFTDQERISYRDIITSNIMTSMKALIKACGRFGLDIADDGLAEDILGAQATEFDAAMGAKVKELWADESIQAAYARRSEFQLTDSASYYFDDIDRICAEGYIPNEQDVLRSRAKTTGITETEFDVDEIHFRMVDVGGQRSERKKWIHCFQDVTAVIFCIALSEYDLKLYEDETVNRMHESIKLFDEICNSKWFSQTSVILFLNKSDLFREKIARVDLKMCFPDYNGGLNFDNGVEYIQEKFVSLNRNPTEKHVYPHVTCATDTENIKFVFNAVKDIILHQALDASGF